MARLVIDIRARLYLADAWRDVSSDVRYAAGISMGRGYGPEDDLAPPATCKFTLDNRSGDYTERNPLGQWYQHLGRNTPMELGVRVAYDDCATNVSSGWGSMNTDSNGRWTPFAWSTAGGAASDFNKAAGKATHLISTADQVRISYLPDYSQREADITYTLSLSFTDILTAPISTALIFRGQSLADYYQLAVVLHTDETIFCDFTRPDGTTLDAGGVDTGLTHSSAQALHIRMQAEGRTLRAKVWHGAVREETEPIAWTYTFTDQGDTGLTDALMDSAGLFGIVSSVAAGNTNVPITFSYDNIDILAPEFSGEVAAWPRTRDVTGNDRTVNITAADITRRLGTGESPLASALCRYILNPPFSGFTPWAYWPLEEDEFTIAGDVQPSAGAGMLGFVPPSSGTAVGKLQWAADRTLPGGKQAPALSGGGSLVMFLGPPTQQNSWSALWCMKQAYAEGTVAAFTTETMHLQFTASRNASSLTMDILQSVDGGVPSTVMSYVFSDKSDVEEWHQFTLECYQLGGDYGLFLHVDGVQVDSHTQSPGTLEGLRRVNLTSVTDAASNIYYAHLVVYSSSAGTLPVPSTFYEPFLGHAGERALVRAERLCDEENIEFDWIGTGIAGTEDGTDPMGAQRPESLLDLMQSCAKVDNGLLYTQRSNGGFQFRTLQTMYSRSPWCELSMSDGHFSPPWGAMADDRALRNDITANRDSGGSYRYQLDDGSRMSVSSPADGGAGRYDSSVTVNVDMDTRLPAQAAWRVHIGTADEDRFPALRLELSREVFRTTAGLALAAKLRDLDIGDLIRLTGMASEGLYEDLDELVVGVSKYLDQFTYDLTLVCRPGSRYHTGEIDSGWRLDSDDTTTNEALDTTETDVDVAFTGTLWTAADQPIDVMIGGERMTVTNVTGSSSPQTLTVTRSVNGVVKSHATGAPVVLADPNYLGM